MRTARITAVLVAGLAVAATLGGATPGHAGNAATAATTGALPSFTPPIRSDDPKLQKTPTEPATVIDSAGRRYVANQLDSELAITEDGGKSWRYPGGMEVLAQNVSGCQVSPGGLIGDVEMATDRGGRTYFSTLGILDGGTADNGIQPLVAYSDDAFKTWHTQCAAHQPFMTDRQWLATYDPPGTPSEATKLYLTYHDFGPDTMWVNRSVNGGQSWELPQPVITDPEAIASSGCDTVPGGVAVDKRNGWIYVSWVAGPQPVNNAATGCNYTQGTIFNKLYVAFSKDDGVTWSNVKAFEGLDNTGEAPNDLSEIFSNIAVDRAGNVYIAYPAFLNGEYGIYYQWAAPSDTGALSFSPPVKVSGTDVHTAYYPRLVAGDDGRIALIYLGTPFKNVPATVFNKESYRGGDNRPDCSPEVTSPGDHGVRFLGKPCMLPDNTQWYLYLATSLDARAATPALTNQRMRPDPVHPGDICTLGIFCLGGDNRDLADVNDVKIDATGGIQAAYTYQAPDKSHNEIIFQCQTGGPGLLAGVTPASCADATVVQPPVAKPPVAPPPVAQPGSGGLPATGLPSEVALAGLVTAAAALALSRARRRASSA
jgi:hypothetical protein